MYYCYCVKMFENVVENDGNVEHSKKSNIYNILMLTVSLLSVVFDVIIGTALVLQYYMSEKYNFAISTVSFIFIPFVIIQVFSIKLYFLNNDMKAAQWILHLLLLGFICRYIITIKKYVRNFQSKTYFAASSVKENMNNLKNLYLFKCFMECVPQLILQLFIISTSNDFLFTSSGEIWYFSGLSIYSSILSLAWALITHTKFKKRNYCSLVWLMLWRIGMISARVSALVLCAHICGPWIILFMGSHWLAMTLWITYQKSTGNERRENGEFHSAIFGLIYCFCFFSLKFGQSKWQAITLNLLFFFENLIFLTVFLARFSSEQPKLAVWAFFIVISGSLLGISSLLVYYMVYNTTETGKCISRVTRILSSKKVNGKNENFSECGSPEGEHHRDVSSSNSVIIIEEDPDPDSNAEEKPEISELRSENIYEEPKESETGHEHLNLPAAMKRRAICSSVDLEKFTENRAGNPEMETETVIADESPSEILSTRDYENICAVNIRREPWGIRSWRGYSDIETLRHDDSVVNEGRSDNLTTSSEYSGKFEDKDSFISEDKSDIDTVSGKVSENFFSPLPLNALEAIVEEEVTETDCKNDTETKCDGKSSLVETIDKICLYTPLRTRSPTIYSYPDNTKTGGISGKNIRDSEKTEKYSVNRKLCLAVEKKDFFSPLKDKFRPAHKLNIFKERYEINRYHIPNKSKDLMVQVNKTCPDKENLRSENNREINKIKHENSTTGKAFSFKENGLFLKEIFTPSKSEKCNYRISYMRR